MAGIGSLTAAMADELTKPFAAIHDQLNLVKTPMSKSIPVDYAIEDVKGLFVAVMKQGSETRKLVTTRMR